MKGCLDRKETQGETRESAEEKETRQGKRSELSLKLNLRETTDGRGYTRKDLAAAAIGALEKRLAKFILTREEEKRVFTL